MEMRHRNRERVEIIDEFKKREIDSVKQVGGQISRQNQGFDVDVNMTTSRKYSETGGKT